jgi:hypothetical protein
MTNHNLTQVLQTFSKKEWKELRKWLQSPVHNQREDVLRLFDFISDQEVNNALEQVDKEAAYRFTYPETPYDDAKFRQVVHFLFKSVEEYLLYQEIRKDPVHTSRVIASVYSKRQLPKFFERAIRLSKETLEEHPFRNGAYLRSDYLLQQEIYSFSSRQQRNTLLNLQEASDALDVTFVADKLRQCCLMLSHQSVYKTDYRMGFLEEVLRYVETHDLLELPAIAMYYYSYKAIAERDNENHFKSLKSHLLLYGHLFPPLEIRDIYILAINYCNFRINKGASAYVSESFELYQRGIETGALIENGEISRWTFRNAVAVGLRHKAFGWVEAFIRDYAAFLNAKHREGYTRFNLAKLYFEKKDYNQAMQLLSTFELNDDILVTLNAKAMLLKMLYEEGEYDALESLLNSLGTYLLRKELMGYHKAHYKLMVRFTKKLLRISPYSHQQRQKLSKEIRETEAFTEKEWFLEQLGKS